MSASFAEEPLEDLGSLSQSPGLPVRERREHGCQEIEAAGTTACQELLSRSCRADSGDPAVACVDLARDEALALEGLDDPRNGRRTHQLS